MMPQPFTHLAIIRPHTVPIKVRRHGKFWVSDRMVNLSYVHRPGDVEQVKPITGLPPVDPDAQGMLA